jgi:hypothetical protein
MLPRRVPQRVKDGASCEVHVDDQEVRLPVVQRRHRRVHRLGQPDREAAMVEREAHDLSQHRLVEHEQHPGWNMERPRIGHHRAPPSVTTHPCLPGDGRNTEAIIRTCRERGTATPRQRCA